jgi:carbon monoxide dehydrogenase subunit G
MRMKISLAVVSDVLRGKVVIEDPDPPAGFRLRVEGSGRIGFLNGAGDVRLSPTGDGATLVSYAGDVHAGGTIAAVGQRLLDTTARMTRRSSKKYYCLGMMSAAALIPWRAVGNADSVGVAGQ